MSPDAHRVYDAIRRAGRHGISRVDFELPDVIDGRKPILNFPGRVKEIRDTLGEHAVRWNGEWRNRCKVWVLGAIPITTPPRPLAPADFMCERGHTWQAPCYRSQLGYPMLYGVECPTCGRDPICVEGEIGPARPEVIAKAAA